MILQNELKIQQERRPNMTEQQKEELLLSMNEKLLNHDKMFEAIFEKLSNHDKMFEIVLEKLSNHDKILLNHSEQFKIINEKLSENSQKISENAQKIESRDDLLVNISKELGLLRTEMNTRFEKVEKELERQRKNMARMEQQLSSKIDMLFDMYQIHEENFSEKDNKIAEINRTLDWHDIRIYKLETAKKEN